jgi:hypothetical protein
MYKTIFRDSFTCYDRRPSMQYRWFLVVACWSVLSGACVDLTLPPQLQRETVPAVVPDAAEPAAPDAAVAPPADASSEPTIGVPPDAAAPPAAKLPLGRRCSTGSDCESGSCTDGVCCGSACTALCYACNLPGMEGTCLAMPSGQDPGSECAQDPPGTCGHDGTCDGSGACRRYPAGMQCEPGKCAGALESAARTCDGNGVCQAGTTRSCAPNACAGSSCGTVCSGDADCQTGFVCEIGTCQAKRPQGSACTSARQCATGYCADGFCCGTPCTEACYACNLPGELGTCTPVPDGSDPGKDCPAESPSTCGRVGGCNGKGACSLHGAGILCATAGCNGASEVPTRMCNGAGQCMGAPARDCGDYVCVESACTTSCTSEAQCRSGLACIGGSCQLPTIIGPTLLLRWTLDDEAGTMAVDSSSNALHGTYIGDSGAPAPSTVVPAVMFPDARSRGFMRAGRHAVQLATIPAVLKPANNFTVSLWFLATSIDSGGAELLSAGNQYLLRLGKDTVRFSKRQAGGTSSAPCDVINITSHLDGKWHHLAGVQSPAGMKVYLDGVERCTNTHGEDVRYDGGPSLFLGRHPDNATYDFEGNLDDVRIYGAALTAAQVQALAQGGN